MLVPGQVLTSAMFIAGKPKAAATILPIPAGKMAVSLALADPNRIGGYLKPGNEVAVFDTFNAAEGSAPGPKTPSGDGISDDFKKNRSTRLVLPRVRVLAIGDEAFGTSFKPATVTTGSNGTITVTLAVDQQQAEKLIQVAQVGHPWLALLTDTSETAPSDGVDNRGLFR
jgi:pilus assembly protein CpaB